MRQITLDGRGRRTIDEIKPGEKSSAKGVAA